MKKKIWVGMLGILLMVSIYAIEIGESYEKIKPSLSFEQNLEITKPRQG
ncbi:MAG: hypothetical protein J7K95_07485 [Thermoplasmata archaeon]|nr:hypothetical protein [Thermoplasmata archaeon]